MRRIVQGRAGLALAFILGLVIATAGSATAARLITGKQVKDGSIGEKDLAASVRAKLKRTGAAGALGARGEAGPKGDPGPRGDTGPAGPGTLTTASAVLPDGAQQQVFLTIPGWGDVRGTCDNIAPNYGIGFVNRSGKVLDFVTTATTGSATLTSTGSLQPDGATATLAASGAASFHLTEQAVDGVPPRVVLIRVGQRLGSACRVWASALAG